MERPDLRSLQKAGLSPGRDGIRTSGIGKPGWPGTGSKGIDETFEAG